MSWLTGLAGKAENFLNNIDQKAATALSKEEVAAASAARQLTSGNPQDPNYSPYLSQTKPPATRPDTLSPNNIPYSVSVPSNLHKLENSHQGRATARKATTPSGSARATTPSGSARQSPVRSKKDKDEELFEFLNSKDLTDAGNGNGSKKPANKSVLNGKHSRDSSVSSTAMSTPTGSKTPEPLSISITNDTPGSDHANGFTDSPDQNTGSSSTGTDDLHGNQTTESSSGYHSNHEDGTPEHLSSLELENRLLRNEVTQLNQEMTSVIHRAKEAHDELNRVRLDLDHHGDRLSHGDQVIRELQSHESDLHEALGAKDSQLAVLRVRLEESDTHKSSMSTHLRDLLQEKDRLLVDHTSVSGVQSQALNTLEDKLQETERTLHREQEKLRRIERDSMERQTSLESDKQQLSQELSSVQRKCNEEKAKCSEMVVQLKSSKAHVDAAKQELAEYKEKATRILQSKDKLIWSLKESCGQGGLEGGVSQAELEEMRQERDMYREEVQRSQMTTEGLRSEIVELEVQLQQDSELARDEISTLEDQLRSEKERREDAEQEVAKQKQELQYAHEELMKQKMAYQTCVRDRESEIERLRSQLTTRNMSTSTQVELENRLHTLTESLIQKQTVLEALNTEKNSLVHQLERMERQYREAESSALRATATAVHIVEEEEGKQAVRNRLPLFMRESPLDGDVTRRVKRAASSIDRFSMKIGVLLRRYPMARIFVICYMALLHLWVSLVLLTYKPEIHGLDYQPRPPSDS